MKRLALVLSFALILSGFALGAQVVTQDAVPQVAETPAMTMATDSLEADAACPVIQTGLITPFANCDIPVWLQDTCDTFQEETCWCDCYNATGATVHCIDRCCD